MHGQTLTQSATPSNRGKIIKTRSSAPLRTTGPAGPGGCCCEGVFCSGGSAPGPEGAGGWGVGGGQHSSRCRWLLYPSSIGGCTASGSSLAPFFSYFRCSSRRDARAPAWCSGSRFGHILPWFRGDEVCAVMGIRWICSR